MRKTTDVVQKLSPNCRQTRGAATQMDNNKRRPAIPPIIHSKIAITIITTLLLIPLLHIWSI